MGPKTLFTNAQAKRQVFWSSGADETHWRRSWEKSDEGLHELVERANSVTRNGLTQERVSPIPEEVVNNQVFGYTKVSSKALRLAESGPDFVQEVGGQVHVSPRSRSYLLNGQNFEKLENLNEVFCCKCDFHVSHEGETSGSSVRFVESSGEVRDHDGSSP